MADAQHRYTLLQKPCTVRQRDCVFLLFRGHEKYRPTITATCWSDWYRALFLVTILCCLPDDDGFSRMRMRAAKGKASVNEF